MNLPNLITSSDKNQFLVEIDLLLNTYFRSEDLDHKAKQQIRNSTYEYFMETLTMMEKKEREKYLEDLKKQVMNIYEVHLSIGFEPSRAFLEEAVVLLREKLGDNLVVNLKIDEKKAANFELELSYKGQFAKA